MSHCRISWWAQCNCLTKLWFHTLPPVLAAGTGDSARSMGRMKHIGRSEDGAQMAALRRCACIRGLIYYVLTPVPVNGTKATPPSLERVTVPFRFLTSFHSVW